MKKAVVTGANGFLGNALCTLFSKKGIKVIAVVRDENADTAVLETLDNVRIVYADLSEFRSLADKIPDRDIDVFYHLAWTGTSGLLRGDYDTQLKNVRYACDTVMACSELGCGRFVFAASIMEYEIAALMETDAVPGINTLYSSAKMSADYMARTVAASLGITYIRAVISNIYGPGEMSPRLINTSLRKLLKGEHCAFTEGTQLYDFIYIDDAVGAFEAVGRCGKANKTYYIGSSAPRRLRDFLCEMRDQADESIKLGFGEISFTGVTLGYDEFDMNAVADDTGFVPSVSFAEGIRRTIDWIREEG